MFVYVTLFDNGTPDWDTAVGSFDTAEAAAAMARQYGPEHRPWAVANVTVVYYEQPR